MNILESYLFYLSLSEREWGTKTENPDSFEKRNFSDLFSLKTDLGTFKKMRHALQPSLYDLYIKNAIGDYLGRPDTMNSITLKNVGFDQFKKDINDLKKKVKYAQKLKSKIRKNYFKPTSGPGETNDPDVGGTDGGDGGDGGGMGGGI